MDNTVAQFTALLQEQGIKLNPEQLKQFELYYQELVYGMKK